MNHYLLIQSAKSKIRLLSAQSPKGVYTIKFGTRKLVLTHYVESWIAVCVYSYRTNTISSWLRGVIPDLSPDEIDAFFNVFKKEHPLDHVEYSYDSIPLIATEKQGLEMRIQIFKEPIIITLRQEKELLDIIRTDSLKFSKYDRLLSWFNSYCEEYGYEARLKRDRANQLEELVESFCYYHGVQITPLKTSLEELIRNNESSKPSNWKANVGAVIIMFVGVMLYIGVAISLVKWADAIVHSGTFSFLFAGLLYILAGAMFCVPLAEIFKPK